jgi:hypothetical protein
VGGQQPEGFTRRYKNMWYTLKGSICLALLLGGSPPNFLPNSIFSLVSGKNVR